MKYTKYSKYAPDAAEDIDLQELMSRLSDFFLQSGYESQFGIYEMDPERSREKMMDELREAILRALQEGDLLPNAWKKKVSFRAPVSPRRSRRPRLKLPGGR
jgi:hypothetical protein